jgi:cyanate permease
MYVMTGITLISSLLFFPIASAPTPATSRTNGKAIRFISFRASRAAWLLGLGFFGYNIGTEAYLTFTPDFLVHRGYPLAVASVIVGNYAYASMSLKPVFSWFLNRANAALFVVVASALAIMSIAVLLLGGLSPNIPSVVMGISLALGMPALYALPPFLFAPEESGQVFGLYQLFYSFGFFAQPLVGRAIDKAGGYGSGYMVMIAYCLVGLFCILPFTRRRPGRPQPAQVEAS